MVITEPKLWPSKWTLPCDANPGLLLHHSLYIRFASLTTANVISTKDLYETYERDTGNIGNLVEGVFKNLQWLTFSVPPLRLKEVWDVLAVDKSTVVTKATQ